jgi:hypothetical protein
LTSEDDDLAPEASIHRYTAPVPPDGLVPGDPILIEAVTAHIERYVGPIGIVWHEIVSEYVHLDVHHVPPTPDRPFNVIVTSGMSERPMHTPPELAEDWRRAELLMCLPSDWPLTEEAFRDERHYWPVRWLKTLARFPHQYATWLGYAHTVPNGDPPEPLGPGTEQSGLMVMPPLLLDEKVHALTTDSGQVIRFWSLLPLYSVEMDLKLRKGSETLLERLDRAGVTDLIDPDRPNVAAKSSRWPF